ncbi:hypothetical protein K435DRAFT_759507 [Dendrothele bispora CBS 962.96]|uniref:Uncharacterized protein n=1 Tax=Dendrothele bispora (strain CBS 962.96) TaxID=1314807 RepID=A0A4S8LP83_DENBC|nr:hypothetical protein K435DRAFT_759507 [Dendrothele bispora CBS 962.96]
MVKRVKTPEPAKDELRYFTVDKPYPLNANWEIREDYITFAKWIAQCIGIQPFFAIYYKPSSRGQVIIEVDHNLNNPSSLLGEHRWCEFLRNPTDEEIPRFSRIFYSLYTSDRAAQKDGWLRIDVKESWFKDWSRENNHMVFPYPETYWCPVPPEDKTNKPLCRHIPCDAKPAPPKIAPPVVGSARWAEDKRDPGANTPTASRGSSTRGTRGGTAMTKSTRNGNKSSPPTLTSATWDQPITKKSSSAKSPPASAWVKPPQVAKSVSQPAQSVWGCGPPASSIPSRPPGLLNTPAALSRPQGVSSSNQSNRKSGPSSVTQSPPVNNLADGMRGMSIRGQKAPIAPAQDDFDEDESDEGGYAWEIPKSEVTFVPPDEVNAAEEPIRNLWGPEEEPEIPQEDLCPEHGIICTKGICSVRAKMERAKRARNAQGQNNANGDSNRGGGRGKGKRKNGRGNKNSVTTQERAQKGDNGGAPGGSGASSRVNSTDNSRAPSAAGNNIPDMDELEREVDLFD